MKKNEPHTLARILKKVAPKIGASVILDTEWGIAGQITFASGKRSYFRYNTLDLNHVGASDIARDKDYANFFMEKLGYPIVPYSKTFFSDDWAQAMSAPERTIEAAYTHAHTIGFPVIVKPNSGSQGSGVALVHSKATFYKALKRIFKSDRVALVQQALIGKDYRLVVLDDIVVAAYERIPLNVIGDGRSTIYMLLVEKQKQFVATSKDTQINVDDPRIAAKLKYQKLTVDFVPAKGEKISLLDNANLSTGGDAVDVTKQLHPEFKTIAVSLTKDMGLRLCGVDIMVAGSISEKPDAYWVLEINAKPGLDHYAQIGKAQQKNAENLYLDILRKIDSK